MSRVITYFLICIAVVSIAVTAIANGDDFGRENLHADRAYYVSTDGSDANDGRTVKSAFQTPQRAWNEICTELDLRGHVASIRLSPGTYPGVTDFAREGGAHGYTGGGWVLIEGTGEPGSVIIDEPRRYSAIWMTASYIEIRHLEVRALRNSSALGAAWGGVIEIGPGVRFGPSSGEHMHASSGGQIRDRSGGYTISGNAQVHLGAYQGGQVRVMGAKVTIEGKPELATFAWATDGGIVDARGARFIGKSIGKRFEGNGIFVTDTNDFTFFPGTIAGRLTLGGRYDDIVSIPEATSLAGRDRDTAAE